MMASAVMADQVPMARPRLERGTTRNHSVDGGILHEIQSTGERLQTG